LIIRLRYTKKFLKLSLNNLGKLNANIIVFRTNRFGIRFGSVRDSIKSNSNLTRFNSIQFEKDRTKRPKRTISAFFHEKHEKYHTITIELNLDSIRIRIVCGILISTFDKIRKLTISIIKLRFGFFFTKCL